MFLFCERVFSSLMAFAAASILIAVAVIHLLICCIDCSRIGWRHRKRYSRYDVFLSFRGRDVRRGFVNHLYHALEGAGFRVFLDSCHLPKGKNISAGLEHAIKVSRILIPVFSTNYAQSAWCLREVSLIAGQVQQQGSAIAVPLFYNVTPAQVRRPDQFHGPFAEAFQKHESSGKYRPQEINEWKAALFTLSNLCGWSLQEDTNGYEEAMVKLVVEYVANTL